MKTARALLPVADVVFYDGGVGSEGGFEKFSGAVRPAGDSVKRKIV